MAVASECECECECEGGCESECEGGAGSLGLWESGVGITNNTWKNGSNRSAQNVSVDRDNDDGRGQGKYGNYEVDSEDHQQSFASDQGQVLGWPKGKGQQALAKLNLVKVRAL